jgi:arylsulfatase
MIENEGHRGYRRDGWEVVTRHVPRTPFSDEHWELYDMAADPTQLRDLAEQEPQRLSEMIAAWEESAWENQVFPLDEGTGYRFLLRPSWTETYDRPVVLAGGTPTLDRWRSQRLILWRDVDITADVTLAEGDAGVLFAHGDQGGGYSLYVDDTGELVAAHNGYGLEREVRGPVVDPGDHRLQLRIRCPGQDRWNLSLAVDGVEVAAEADFRLLMAMAPFEGIDVGIDRRSPVCWSVYERHGPFPFSGVLRSVAYEPGAPAPDSPTGFMDFLKDWGRSFE